MVWTLFLAQQSQFHDKFYNSTVLHPLGLAALLLGAVLIFSLPRRLAMFPFLGIVCFIPSIQRINIGGLDWTLLRLMILASWARILSKGELYKIRWTKLDSFIVYWAVAEFIAYSLKRGDSGGVIFISGTMFDALGLYFVVRALIGSWEDVQRLGLGLVIISIPLSFAFLFEKMTGRNLFATFGGASKITLIRDGRLRAVGAFSHPILAGCFVASLMPFIGALWWAGHKYKTQAMVGIACCMVVIFACASSTPVAAILAGLIAFTAFKYRKEMKSIRMSIAAALVFMHLVMEKPVWHLVCRIDLAGGSTGWHRFVLIDNFIHRYKEWGALGTLGTGHWGRGMFDVTNQYVLEGVRGGIMALIFFIMTIVTAYGSVGKLWRSAGNDQARVAMAWACGVSLFIHSANFIGVSYFGQANFSWYLTLGVIASLISLPEVEHATEAAHLQPVRIDEPAPMRRLARPKRRGVLRKIPAGS